MIDAALCPDGMVVLMANGVAADVSVRIASGEVAIVATDGRRVAGAILAHNIISRLASSDRADVILVGADGIVGYDAAIDTGA